MLLITGASGWIGSRLVTIAGRRGLRTAAVEARAFGQHRGTAAGTADFRAAGATGLIHLAAIAHRGGVGEADYAAVNCELVLTLARAARDAGVPRFVFVSSARVMGETSPHPWSELDSPAPADAYSRAKWQAEQALAALADPGCFDVTIVRPPLVYGPGVRANFLRLLRLAATPLPLPVADDAGARSMIHLDNLVDALLYCATVPGAAVPAGADGARTWFVRDGHDLTTPELIAALRRSAGRPSRLVPMSGRLIRRMARLAGREAEAIRLFGTARVDDRAIRASGWRPPLAIDTAVASTMRWFVAVGRRQPATGGPQPT